MLKAIDVMKQIWELENIHVRIKSSTELPEYPFKRKYPENRTVGDWARNRLSAYKTSTIEILNGKNSIPLDTLRIEALRKSYNKAARESINAKFKVEVFRKKFIRSKKDLVVQEEKTEQILNLVTEISGAKCEMEEELNIYRKLFKHTEYICDKIDDVIKDVFCMHLKGVDESDVLLTKINSKLLVIETKKLLFQIKQALK